MLDFINHEANQKVHDLVQDGISYLDTRTEFWRQQKPLYARKKDKPVKGRKIMTRDQVAMMKLSKFMKKLEDIDAGEKLLIFKNVHLLKSYRVSQENYSDLGWSSDEDLALVNCLSIP